MGAAGRDFHNFNVFFRDNEEYEVVAFTAAQIPNIENRTYPASLAGRLYPSGIPIYPESQLAELIRRHRVDIVVFAYSDVSYEYVMERASWAMAHGSDWWLLGPKATQLRSKKPVIAICAVRTGAGKSQTTRRVVEILKEMNKTVCVVRHPMPYGNLEDMVVQRITSLSDLDKYKCTIEEREEYEKHLRAGTTVFAGVDYEKILAEAEKDFDIIVWDGGNNDFPFFRPNLLITVVDPLRAGHEISYYPGSMLFRSAQIIVINKMDSATPEQIKMIQNNIGLYNPRAKVIEAHSLLVVSEPEMIRGKRVIVVEDGPTLTHGEMSYGAGAVAAQRYGAAEIIEPMPFAIGSILDAYEKYPHLKKCLPALGYSEVQIKELETTINNTPADIVITATPINLSSILKVNKPIVNVEYHLKEISQLTIKDILIEFFDGKDSKENADEIIG
jgi:predicted GTPase